MFDTVSIISLFAPGLAVPFSLHSFVMLVPKVPTPADGASVHHLLLLLLLLLLKLLCLVAKLLFLLCT